MIEAEISCSTCSMKNHCMERSREYPCIDYKPQTKKQERRRNGVRRTETRYATGETAQSTSA